MIIQIPKSFAENWAGDSHIRTHPKEVEEACKQALEHEVSYDFGFRKYIYWRDDMGKQDGKSFCNVHLMIGYCPQTLAWYAYMMEELQKAFPDANLHNVNCHQVRKSDCVQGFTLITFDSYQERKDYPGYHAAKSCDYYW